MGETLGRRENMASPGTRGKSVGVVLAEAEYIISPVPFLYITLLFVFVHNSQSAPKFLSGTKLPLYAVACNMRPCGQWGCIKGSLRNAEGENFLSKTSTFRLAGI